LRKAKFVDLWTIECLLRPYDVRPIYFDTLNLDEENNGEQQVTEHVSKKRNRDNMEGEEKQDDVHIEQEYGFRDEEGQQQESKEEEGESEVKQELQPMKIKSASKKIIGARPFHQARGHTGYLTFARKRSILQDDTNKQLKQNIME